MSPVALSGRTAIRHFLLTSSLIVAAFIAGFGHNILPATYFNDERFIRQLLDRSAQSDEGSFQFTASVYSALGLAGHPLLASLLSFTLFLLLTFKVLGWSDLCRTDLRVFLVTCGAILLSSVYLAQYSKEFLVIGLSLLFIVARRHWCLEILWLALAVLYAYFVRDYWYLVVALFLGFRLITWWRRSTITVVLGMVIAYAALVGAFQGILGVPLTHFRTTVQLYLDATTMIEDPIASTSYLPQLINVIIVLVMLFIPFPLMLSFHPLQILLAGYLALLWSTLYLHLKFVLNKPDGSPLNSETMRAMCLVLAFVVVQAIFEPDYGSYIKHLLPMIPIALLMVSTRNGSTIGPRT